MTYADQIRRENLQVVRTTAGRFAATATGRQPLDRGDALRRFRAAQRTLKPRDERFAHLKAAHD